MRGVFLINYWEFFINKSFEVDLSCNITSQTNRKEDFETEIHWVTSKKTIHSITV